MERPSRSFTDLQPGPGRSRDSSTQRDRPSRAAARSELQQPGMVSGQHADRGCSWRRADLSSRDLHGCAQRRRFPTGYAQPVRRRRAGLATASHSAQAPLNARPREQKHQQSRDTPGGWTRQRGNPEPVRHDPRMLLRLMWAVVCIRRRISTVYAGKSRRGFPDAGPGEVARPCEIAARAGTLVGRIRLQPKVPVEELSLGRVIVL